MTPRVTWKLQAAIAFGFFAFGLYGAVEPRINQSVPVLFFLSVYAIVVSHALGAQKSRELAEALRHPPEHKVVEALVERTDVEAVDTPVMGG